MSFYSQDGMTILEWKEDITFQTIDQFRESMNELLLQPASVVILNIKQVAYVNSAALGILADSVVKGRRGGKEMLIAGIQPTVGEVFSIVKFEKFIKLFTELDLALEYGRTVVAAN